MFKIAIGTANFSYKYGIDQSKIIDAEIIKILKLLEKNKITYIDTAIDYNFKKKFINKFNSKNLKVTTKIKLPLTNKLEFISNIKRTILRELKKLNIDKFETILLHNINDLKFAKYRLPLLKELKKLKKENLTLKIGASIYDPNELKFLYKNFKPDVIQIPLNIFDQRFANDRLLKRLKKKNTLIQARSVFLQGLLLKKSNELNMIKQKVKLKKKLKKFNSWCSLRNISQLSANISYIKSIKYIDLFIFGINSSLQLKEILSNLKKKENIEDFSQFSTTDKKIIDPRKW